MARDSIIKRGNVYQIRYRIGKKQKAKTIGTNKKVAERVLAQIINDIHNGSYTEIKEISFKDFSQKWLNDYARPHVKDSTFYGYSNKIYVRRSVCWRKQKKPDNTTRR